MIPGYIRYVRDGLTMEIFKLHTISKCKGLVSRFISGNMSAKSSAEEVGLRHLIEKPQFIRETPVDTVFQRLENDILSKVDTPVGIQTLYESVGAANNGAFVEILLQFLLEIHEATCQMQLNDIDAIKENLLPISLHDMRQLETLILLVIIQGIDSNLPPAFQLPHDFNYMENTEKYQSVCIVPAQHKSNTDVLRNTVKSLYSIFAAPKIKNDYIRSILLNGPLYTSVLVAIMSLCISSSSSAECDLFDKFEALQDTYELFTIYTRLIRDLEGQEVQDFVLDKLSTLTVRRDDGVLSLIDFITSARENEQIDLEKVNRVTQILVPKPKSLTRVTYFSKLFTQIYRDLSKIDKPIVISCLNNLIATFYAKNPKIVVDFLFRKIYVVLFNLSLKDHSSTELNNMINVLISLTKNPSAELIQALVATNDTNSFFLHLWVYALFLRKYQKLNPAISSDESNRKQQDSPPYYNVILALLKNFIILTDHRDVINVISLNLVNFQHDKWKYSIDFQTQLPYISVDGNGHQINEIGVSGTKPKKFEGIFHDIDLAIEMLVKLLKMINSEDITKDIFLAVLSRWVKKTSLKEENNTNQVLVDDPVDSILVLIDMKTLESLNKEFESDIIRKPGDILVMITELMDFVAQQQLEHENEQVNSDDEDIDLETQGDKTNHEFEIVLQLLITILQNTKIDELLPFKQLLAKIDTTFVTSLYDANDYLHKRIVEVVQTNADDLVTLDPDSARDQMLLDHALDNINDALEPIKVRGLKELMKLFRQRSTVIDIDRLFSFQMQYLKHSDPFIYLNVIKHITELCQAEPKKILPALLKIYLNIDKRNKLDDILKVGEIMINFIQRQNELFQGPTANSVVDACIVIVRGHKELNEKIRMSAVSVLGVSIKTNPRGIQSSVPDILDCVFGILQLEREDKYDKNAFLVRRAAVHLLHDLIHSTTTTLLPEQYNYTKIKTLLSYIKHTDTDLLVREQARTIISELDKLYI